MPVRYFSGTQTQYKNLHRKVNRIKGKPERCTRCGSVDWVEWANISGEYLHDIADYMALCRKCHRQYDLASYQDEPKKDRCVNGHPFTPENTYVPPVREGQRAPRRNCRACRRDNVKRYRLRRS